LVWIDEIRAKSPWKSAEDDSLWKRTRVTSDTERKPWNLPDGALIIFPSIYPPTHPPTPIKTGGGGEEKQFGLDLLFVSSGPVCLGLDGKKVWTLASHEDSRFLTASSVGEDLGGHIGIK
jgi:hypothetical protein